MLKKGISNYRRHSYNGLSDKTKSLIERSLITNRIRLSPVDFFEKIDGIIRDGLLIRHQDITRLLNNINNFKREPRIKTMFETGTTEGIGDVWMRNKCENFIARLDSIMDIDTFNIALGGVRNRISYSELFPIGLSINQAGASGYGAFHMILHKRVRKRTTFTFTDSIWMLGSFWKSSISSFRLKSNDKKNINGMINFYKRSKGNQVKGYCEAQIWGGIDLRRGDVISISIKKDDHLFHLDNPHYKELLDIFRFYGIDVKIQPQKSHKRPL